MSITPKEITIDVDNGVHVASFSYYDGIAYAKDKGLEHTTSFNDVKARTHYMVCCGDVMVRVEDTDYIEMQRRAF